MSEITGHYPASPPDPEITGLHVWPYSCYHHGEQWYIVCESDSVCALVKDTFLDLYDDDRTDGKTGAQEMAEHMVDLLNADFLKHWQELQSTQPSEEKS